jgi:hypothetical protein
MGHNMPPPVIPLRGGASRGEGTITKKVSLTNNSFE